MAKVKIGLALGGGAARGWAHIGVLRGLLEAGIVPDIIAGTSIGAVVGGCHIAGRLEQLDEFARQLTRRKIFGYLDFNMAGSGLITGQRLCDRLGEHLGDVEIESFDTTYTAVATEIGTGHEIWISKGRLVDAMRASYALPGIFKPVNVSGRWLFDGALVNPVPVSVCRALGARYVIAVNLNADMCGRGTIVPNMGVDKVEQAVVEAPPPEKTGALSALKLLHRQLFGRSGGEEPTPGISTVVVDAFNIVQDRIARSRLAGDPPDAMISPRLMGIGPFDFHRADDLIARGYAAVSRDIEDITNEIASRHRFEPRMAVRAMNGEAVTP